MSPPQRPQTLRTVQGGPIVLVSHHLKGPNGEVFDNRLPCNWSQVRFGNYWNQFLDPEHFYPDDQYFINWTDEIHLSPAVIANYFLGTLVKEALAAMVVRNKDLKNQELSIYKIEVIPEYYLPAGKSCKVALCFFSHQWVDNLTNTCIKDDVLAELKKLRLSNRLKVEEAQILTQTSPEEVRLLHGLCIPCTMPERLVKSNEMSCLLLTLKAEKN